MFIKHHGSIGQNWSPGSILNIPGGITGSLAAPSLMMNEFAIAAMNRNEASTASSASSKSLFAVAMDCYDYCLV